jgi:hypothetical protein
MAKSKKPAAASNCPFIGLRDDSRTFLAYPSTGNHCFHCRFPAVPLLTHQEVYCLGGKHADCPVYRQDDNKHFPPQFRASKSHRTAQSGSTGRLLVIFIGILLLGLVGFIFFRKFITPPLMIPSQTFPTQTVLTTIQPSAMIVPPTHSPVPTSALIPTTTSLPPVHSLEVPINVGDHIFIIHRVVEGQTFEMLAVTYTTTSEVIRALNPSLNPPLLANSAIVISPGLQSIDPALPTFQAYEVSEAEITIDELAQELKVDSTLLRNFNACPDNCRLAAGDWLIIPIPK